MIGFPDETADDHPDGHSHRGVWHNRRVHVAVASFADGATTDLAAIARDVD
jgi:hypothetical protein